MIYSLTGKVERLDDNTVVVNTGSVAYEVTCSVFAVQELCSGQEPKTVLTYLQVREDAMSLFGFANKKEKILFNDLTQVSGVGPKMAITILSGLQIDDLVKAIVNSDVKTLSGIKGLGKKTAERVALELGTKLGSTDALEAIVSGANKVSDKTLPKQIEEAVEVLVSTGLTKTQALDIARENYKENITSEALVALCFKNLR